MHDACEMCLLQTLRDCSREPQTSPSIPNERELMLMQRAEFHVFANDERLRLVAFVQNANDKRMLNPPKRIHLAPEPLLCLRRDCLTLEPFQSAAREGPRMHDQLDVALSA